MVGSFGECIYNGKINIDEVEMDQNKLIKNLVEFNNKSKPKTIEGKDKRRDTYESAYALYDGRKYILNAFKSGIFSIKEQRVKDSKY